MGACLTKAKESGAVDKGIDAAAKNKDKVASGVKTAAAKAGVDEQTAQKAGTAVEGALQNKEALKAGVNKALGSAGGDAPAAPAEAAA